MATTLELLRSQLDAYADPWEAGPAEEPARRELEGWLRVGLSLFGQIRLLGEQWCDSVRSGAAAFPGDSEDEYARAVRALYESWLRNFGRLADDVRRREASGHAVAGAAEFAEACREAAGASCISRERAAAAARHLGQGKGRPMAEVRDEVRRRLLAGS